MTTTMNEALKSNLSLGMLGVVTLLTVYNTFFNEPKAPRSRTMEASTNLLAPPPPPPAPETNQMITPPANTDEFSNPNPNAQPSSPPTKVSFSQPNHDFGKIKQNTENRHVFKFTNTGTNPLIISDAKGSCGCTVPKYPKEPIAPGKTGEIEIVYSPGMQQGNQSKTVTITANTEPAVTTLTIRAEVQTE
jgi:hypothetical protein